MKSKIITVDLSKLAAQYPVEFLLVYWDILGATTDNSLHLLRLNSIMFEVPKYNALCHLVQYNQKLSLAKILHGKYCTRSFRCYSYSTYGKRVMQENNDAKIAFLWLLMKLNKDLETKWTGNYINVASPVVCEKDNTIEKSFKLFDLKPFSIKACPSFMNDSRDLTQIWDEYQTFKRFVLDAKPNEDDITKLIEEAEWPST